MQHFKFVNWRIGEFVVSFFDVMNKLLMGGKSGFVKTCDENSLKDRGSSRRDKDRRSDRDSNKKSRRESSSSSSGSSRSSSSSSSGSSRSSSSSSSSSRSRSRDKKGKTIFHVKIREIV